MHSVTWGASVDDGRIGAARAALHLIHTGGNMIAGRYTDYMYDFISRVLTEIGPRGSCSEEEKETGHLFAGEIEPACEHIDVESFTCSPMAAFGVFPFLVLGYIAGVVLYFFIPLVSTILAALGILIVFYEVVRCKELVDFLFPKREGENVAGIVRPSGKTSQRVIVSAHLDSAYEFKLWYWFKGFSIPIMALGFAAPVLLFAFGLARTIADWSAASDAAVWTVLGIILIAISPVIILFLFFHTRDIVPGAMDDLAGVSVVAGLGKYLQDARYNGEFYPENTEIVLLGTSSEEAGLRGAMRYTDKHIKELLSLPTYGIFLDGIYDERFLTVVKRELWTGAKHDPYLVELAVETSKSNGFEVISKTFPVGATDATAFSWSKVPAVALMCADSSRLIPNYHTRLDTIETIRPESLAVSLQVVIDMIESIDRG
jgi:hypothetical protein